MTTHKSIIHIFAVIGLILLICSQLGWLTDNDKTEFLMEIKNNMEASPKSEGAEKFLNEYFYTIAMTPEEKTINIERIIYTGIWLKNGERQGDLLSGVIKLRNIHGEISPTLASLSDLESWAETTPFWEWLAIFILIITTGITIFEDRKKT